MAVARRVVVICEWVLVTLFGLLLLILILDLPSAWFAKNCFEQPIGGQGCYPWGGEGPAADAGWSYASKQNYLASGFYSLAVAAIALGLALVLRTGRRLLVLVPALLLLQNTEFVLKPLLPHLPVIGSP